jgi:transcription initiation factor IIE alpha subunit
MRRKGNGLSAETKLVFFVLRAHYDRETGHARVSQEEIARTLGATARSVRSALNRLRQLRLINYRRIPEEKVNSYSFRKHPWQGLAPGGTGPSTLKSI